MTIKPKNTYQSVGSKERIILGYRSELVALSREYSSLKHQALMGNAPEFLPEKFLSIELRIDEIHDRINLVEAGYDSNCEIIPIEQINRLYRRAETLLMRNDLSIAREIHGYAKELELYRNHLLLGMDTEPDGQRRALWIMRRSTAELTEYCRVALDPMKFLDPEDHKECCQRFVHDYLREACKAVDDRSQNSSDMMEDPSIPVPGGVE